MIVSADVLRLRLANQRLTRPGQDVAHVVAHLGAVQSQDYPAATWALGLRLLGIHISAVEAAFNQGMILRPRTCCDRPGTSSRRRTSAGCWRSALLASALPSPPTRAASGSTSRRSKKCSAVVAQALRGGKSLTRAELGAILHDAGLPATDGATLGRMLFHAELKGWSAADLDVGATTPTPCFRSERRWPHTWTETPR